MTLPLTGTGGLGAPAASPAHAGEENKAVALVAGLLILLGLAMRAAGTRGDLWLDEIWTLELVRPLAGWWQVFTEIPHDNNHWLNSAWVMLAGADAPAPMLRAASVTFGAAAVCAAGWAMRGAPAMLAAMALVALSPALVNYGSEARGYSGLVLATLLAVALVRRELERPSPAGPFLLGAVVLFGLFSHAFMVETLAVLAVWVLAARTADAGWPRAVRDGARLFWPAGLAGAAWAGCLAWAVSRHGYGFGGMFVASSADFVSGWAEALRAVFGIPEAWSATLCLGVAAAMVAAALAGRRDAFAWVCVGAFLSIPALLYVLSIPNTVFGRYFLVPCLFLLLALAQAFGDAVRHGGPARVLAGTLLATVLALQLAGTTDFLVLGRGRYGEAIDLMAGEEGDVTYGSDRAARAQRIVSHYASRKGVEARLVPEEAWCAEPPRWMIRDGRSMPNMLTVCPAAPRTYRLAARWPSWRHSGAPWSLYRLDDVPGPAAGAGHGLRPGL